VHTGQYQLSARSILRLMAGFPEYRPLAVAALEAIVSDSRDDDDSQKHMLAGDADTAINSRPALPGYPESAGRNVAYSRSPRSDSSLPSGLAPVRAVSGPFGVPSQPYPPGSTLRTGYREHHARLLRSRGGRRGDPLSGRDGGSVPSVTVAECAEHKHS